MALQGSYSEQATRFHWIGASCGRLQDSINQRLKFEPLRQLWNDTTGRPIFCLAILVVSGNLLDMAAYNAYVIFSHVRPEHEAGKNHRR